MALRPYHAAGAATFLILAAGQAEAQRGSRPVLPPILSAATVDDEADMVAGRLRPGSPAAARDRMIGVLPLADNIELGIGRYGVSEIARPRTHMEADRHPTDVRRRGRGIAGVGFKVSF